MASQNSQRRRNSPDPFELERLAEELVAREQANFAPSDGIQSTSEHSPSNIKHELPIHVPLSHDNLYLTADMFSVEDFLISRSHTSLQDLRTELRDYLSTLKEELVLLINDDYEAFISLSTDLKGEGMRLEKLKYPLGDLRCEIDGSRKGLQDIQAAIKDKLETRSKLRDEKALLHLLLKISESVTRLESLLLISHPTHEAPSLSNITELKVPHHLLSDEQGDISSKTRGNRAKHLSRVATEYTQLLYHVSKARLEKCVYVDEIQWSVDRIQTTLSSDLDHLFASTLATLTDANEGKASEMDRAKAAADLTECLRTYDMLGLWRTAEELLRRDVMRPFIRKTIFSEALAAPHSPIMPRTPLPSSTLGVPAKVSNPPRTPYTPFTAFASKQNPFDLVYSSPQSLQLLDESGDSLAGLYNQILRFVERDLGRIMEFAENVSLKSASQYKDKDKIADLFAVPMTKDQSDIHKDGFNIMANVIWAEISKAIMEELGNVVFASGNPDQFRKHHATTQAFIRALEVLAPSTHCIQTMRSHSTYTTFSRRWQLPVYFQLRWKEIVGKLEDSLVTTTIVPVSQSATVKGSFMTTQAADIWTSISTCWSAEVYIPDLGFRFWKLTLQFISRYKGWLDNSLPSDLSTRTVTALISDKGVTPSSLSRTATPVPPSDASSTESAVADEPLLKQLSAALVDIKALTSHTWTLWREEISMMLPEISGAEEDTNSLEETLMRQLSTLEDLVNPLSNQVIGVLTRRCCDALLPVRSIPSQFRAMSSKRAPTEPSYFVSAILRPIKGFFGIGSSGPGERLKGDHMKPIATEVIDNVCQRYTQYLTAMKRAEGSLRRLEKGRRSALSLFGNAAKDDSRDEERIRTQMVLDVEAFAQDGKALGVDVTSMDNFKLLHTMVHTELIDEL
ncbi:oligomeric golgi complex component, COG2-domain-containing protein [Hygrophoropsis aurantiaca]|uniref:Oligomeric golgi complex component, COG2-domain-containing protein n=1 Tax=Hygrophoropsis aurantiaca TaxID=72124 RepID=A0ACB8ALM3_9AGAM|nr:oligomeric golgi complex component, COG2-domain-containing protein [Hygrophoropsis aurantiaca]